MGVDFLIQAGIFASIILLAMLINVAIRSHRKSIESDTRRVRLATHALDRHVEAMRAVLSDPEVSPEIRSFMLDLSVAVGTRETAAAIPDLIVADKPDIAGDDVRAEGFAEFAAAMKRLEMRSPRTAEEVEVAMRSGLAAMILQWPEAYYRLNLLLSGWNIGSTSDVAARARRIISETKRTPDQSIPPDAAIA